MLNLILNAVEALSGSSKTARELLIRTELDGPGGVLVAVEDSGPGLKPQSLDGPFDAFYTTKPGGMGMGLSICRSIIEVHGGRVWATANVPKGARPSVHSTPTEGDRVLSKRPPRGNAIIHGLGIGGVVAPGTGRESLKLVAQIDRGLSSGLGVSCRCRICRTQNFRCYSVVPAVSIR